MSDWGYCEHCGEYADLPRHRRERQLLMARFDPEDFGEEWTETCGEHWVFAPNQERTERLAAETFAKHYDSGAGWCEYPEKRTVWVREPGEEGEGRPYQVSIEMVPEYNATKLTSCSGGCGKLVTLGIPCYDCRQKAQAAKTA